MTTGDHDLDAWLGPALDELTPEQREVVVDAARDIAGRYPDPDDQHRREAALSATVQYLLGEITPDEAGRAKVAAELARDAAAAAAIQVAVLRHRVDRVDKAVAAREAGINRMTLLKALGER